MKININVGIIGFSLHEQEKFEHIFQASLERERCYKLKDLTLNEVVDVVIVKTATESAFKKLDAYRIYHPHVPVVTAGKAEVEGFSHHIQGVLLISRVLKTLDDVEVDLQTNQDHEINASFMAETDSVDVSGQYDILVVNDDEAMRKALKEELSKSDIPLNIDFAINGQTAIEKIKQKYYDFLFVDAKTPNFSEIDLHIKAGSQDKGVRPSVVMPTLKESVAEEVHVVLRVLKAFADADDMSDTEYKNESTQIGESYNVLLIDDSEMMHTALKIELQKSLIPLHIESAFSGEEALEKIANKYYDFIFLDVMMPGMDGFETCDKIRKVKNMSKLPIIMLTSKTSPLDEVKGIVAGCTTYLTKPIKPDDFQKMLARIVRWLRDFKKDF
jgi:DNA-binding response OmpR family regulator